MSLGGATVASPSRHCTGVILAGGAHTRFGAPKGLETIGGARIIDRVAHALQETTDSLILSANAREAAEWLPGVEVVRDLTPEQGPLGGLQAAFAAARDSILVVAWDMPFVTTSLLRALRQRGEEGAVGVVPVGESGDPEPLCAWYAPEMRRLIDELLARGERRASALVSAPGIVTLSSPQVARHGDPAMLFASVNTPEALERARGRLPH